MIEVREISMNDALYQKERDLRNRILMQPIGLPDFGWEMFDSQSSHIVALSGEELIGCVLLARENQKTGRLLQMAVESNQQRKGIGQKLVNSLIESARKKSFEKITCHARQDAAEFYKKLGFIIVGEPFEEAGVEHFHMLLNLIE